MRFVLAAFLLSLSGTVSADPGDQFELSNVSSTELVKPLQKQRTGLTQDPNVLDGFSVSKFAQGLGSISDIALAEDGSVYISDSKFGRLVRISDRDLDGQADMRQTVIDNLDHPSGISVYEDFVFVADTQAIWKLNVKTNQVESFVSLKNIEAAPHKALLIKDDALWIGLTRAGQTGEIISIDHATRVAQKISEGPGPIYDIDGSSTSPVWITANTAVMPFMPNKYGQFATQLEHGALAGSVLIPRISSETETGFASLKDHLIVTQVGAAKMPNSASGGQNIISLPTQFGQPKGTMQVLLDGFVSDTGRTASGEPDKLAMDERGLFFSDRWNGTIWRVFETPTIIETPKIEGTEPDIVIREATEAETAAIQSRIGAYDGSAFKSKIVGSQIEGSQIKSASTIETGSTIVDAWEAEQEARRAAEAAEDGDDRDE